MEEVEEPACDSSAYHRKHAACACFQLDHQSRPSTLKFDVSLVGIPSYGDQACHEEVSTPNARMTMDLHFGGPFNKSKIWNERKLPYIGPLVAFVVLVTAASFSRRVCRSQA